MKTVDQFNTAFEHVPTGVKVGADVMSVSVILGTLFNHLPSIAAGLSIIWTGIRIYETKTCQRLVARISARIRKTSPANSN
jgi:hypothetical protein